MRKLLNYISALAISCILTASCCPIKKNSNISASATDQTPVQMIPQNTEVIQELGHFPESKKGFRRFVIVPELKLSGDKNSYQIEIIPGKTILADCNHHSLMGNLLEKEVEGWGYQYFEFVTDGNIISTKMACPDYTPTEKFVSGETKMVPYNGKLPIVVYAPIGFEIRYKIWQANELQPAQTR